MNQLRDAILALMGTPTMQPSPPSWWGRAGRRSDGHTGLSLPSYLRGMLDLLSQSCPDNRRSTARGVVTKRDCASRRFRCLSGMFYSVKIQLMVCSLSTVCLISSHQPSQRHCGFISSSRSFSQAEEFPKLEMLEQSRPAL